MSELAKQAAQIGLQLRGWMESRSHWCDPEAGTELCV